MKKQDENLAVADFYMVCRTLKYDPRNILGRCRHSSTVKRRIEVIEALSMAGHGVVAIGKAMERDRSTIAHHLKNTGLRVPKARGKR